MYSTCTCTCMYTVEAVLNTWTDVPEWCNMCALCMYSAHHVMYARTLSLRLYTVQYAYMCSTCAVHVQVYSEYCTMMMSHNQNAYD